jgi:pyrimidine-nucleoside phosphorylase
MFVTPLIERKRDGGALTPAEWSALIRAYAAGDVPDYQMSALLMAVYLNGLMPDELRALTSAMLGSGASLTFSPDTSPRVDKHSTGGVGDKVSLVLAPLVASCGIAVPMMSGRGLGHTGGTLDKLEAIPGFRTDLTLDQARAQVERLGCVMIGQTAEIAPADRKLYALRDATATVETVPLIAASIMSKKLAEGLNGLVLDVKRGGGAFLPQLEDGLELARTMIAIGAEYGCPTVALVTAMDRPLGHACGNALETEEAFAALRGEGPHDLRDVVLALAAEMLVLGEVETDVGAARGRAAEAIDSGAAAEVLRAVIEAQGGNPAVMDDPAVLPHAPVRIVYEAPASGIVARIDARAIGRAVVALGGGRATMEDTVDHGVGFVITAKPGMRVEHGEPLATVYGSDAAAASRGRESLRRAIEIADEPATSPLPLVSHRVTIAGVESFR